MARVSKTNPFKPREQTQTQSKSGNEGEQKDEEKCSSSTNTSSGTNSEENTQDKNQGQAKGTKRGNQKSPLYERIIGHEKAKETVTGRGRGKSKAYTVTLLRKYNIRPRRKGMDGLVSTELETTIVDPIPKSTQDEEKPKGKRLMQSKRENPNATLNEMIYGPERAKRTVSKRGRGKPAAYTARLWWKHNRKGVDGHASTEFETEVADPKAKSTQGKEEKAKGKRPMQNATLNEMISGPERCQRTKGAVTKRGRGKSMAYTLKLLKKYNLKPPWEEKEDQKDVFPEAELEEACKKTDIQRRDDDDIDNDRPGAGTLRNLTGIEVVAK